MKLLYVFACAVLGSAVIPARAEETVKLNVGAQLSRFALLKQGVHRYLRYTVNGPKRTPIDIWTRTIAFEPQEGQRRMHIFMRWDEASGEVAYLEQDSWFEVDTFRPLTHVRRLQRTAGGKVETGGYRFQPDKIIGMTDLTDNMRSDFSQVSPEPAYNFEYDMEMLQALPLAQGYTVSIPFYDAGPGQSAPNRYVFKVAGSDTIVSDDGGRLDCWLVTADYNTGKIQSRFWFEKKSQVLLREEQVQSDDSILIKTLLRDESKRP